MKPSKLVLLVLICALGLAPGQSLAGEEPLRVTATFYPLYIAALNVTVDVPGVEVSCLAPPSAGCLHDYQMTTDDRRALEDSHVVILNGAGLEGFLEKVLPTLAADLIDTTAGMTLLADEDGPNAHVWVSVQGMIGQTRAIAAGLSAADPDHADQYAANADAYIASLEALYAQMRETLAPCAGAPIITFHEAFAYFAEDFGLRVVATVHNHSDSAPSARAIAALAETVKAENIRALFAEPQYDDASVDILARETGLPVYLLDPAVSGDVDSPDLDAYLTIMRRNMNTLVEALS